MCPFCPRWRDSANRVRRTGFASTQVLVAKRKKWVVHTQGPALLLRLCIYKDIKEEDRRTTGKAQRRPMRYAGQTLAMEKTGNPGVGSQVWGLMGVSRAFKGRQAVHNALDDINGWGGGAAMAQCAQGPLAGLEGGSQWCALPTEDKSCGRGGENRHRVPTTRSALQGLREEGFEVCHRQRFAEQVALVQVATGLAQ